MKRSFASCLLAVVACSKSEPTPSAGSATPPGSATSPGSAATTIVAIDARVATTIADAASTAELAIDATTAVAGPAAPPDAAPDRVDRADPDSDRVTYADMLSSDGNTGTGDMIKRRPGSDLASQIEAVRESGRNVAVGRPRPDTRTPVPAPTTGPNGRVSVANKQTFDNSTLTVDVVLQRILSVYMTGIKRCYKETLKKDPTARGKMKLDFTVNEIGRTVNGKANGFVAELDTCVTGQMSNWRFPVPKDKDDEPTDAAFEIALTLVPD